MIVLQLLRDEKMKSSEIKTNTERLEVLVQQNPKPKLRYISLECNALGRLQEGLIHNRNYLMREYKS